MHTCSHLSFFRRTLATTIVVLSPSLVQAEPQMLDKELLCSDCGVQRVVFCVSTTVSKPSSTAADIMAREDESISSPSSPALSDVLFLSSILQLWYPCINEPGTGYISNARVDAIVALVVDGFLETAIPITWYSANDAEVSKTLLTQRKHSCIGHEINAFTR